MSVCLCVCREYPCDQVAMLNVTLLYVGSPLSSVRDIAVHLLHLLYKRFFIDDFVLANRPAPTGADVEEWRLTREELFAGPGCRSQVHLSLTLAKLHPDLTMPMFSGLSLCLSVCLCVSRTSVSSTNACSMYKCSEADGMLHIQDNSEQPVTHTVQPVTIQPVTHTVQPVTHTVQPVTHTVQPVTHTVQPVTVQPVTHTIQPVTHTVQPVTIQRVTHTVQPVTIQCVTHTVQPVTHMVQYNLSLTRYNACEYVIYCNQ